MLYFLRCPDHNVDVPPISERERRKREEKRLKEEAKLYRRQRSLGKRISQVFWGTVFIGLIVFHLGGGYVYGQQVVDRAFAVSTDTSFAEVDSTFAAAGIDAEKVSYDTELGPMDAWRTFGGSSTWVIHVHGKGGSPTAFTPLVKALQDAGYPQLVISYRNDPGQPADPSGYHQHGVTEWEDLAAAVDYARAQGARRLILSGQSMGAGLIFGYSLRQDEEVVSAIVLDSPSLDMSANVKYGASQESLPFGLPIPPTLPPVAVFVASVQTNANFDLMNYSKRAGQLVVPILVLHGTDDKTVPVQTSRDLAADRPATVVLVEFPGADHAEAQTVDPERYLSTIVSFVNANANG